jgi:tetratricopeptide (TPR) repeat protein
MIRGERLDPGSTIEDFVLGAPLGSGGFGTVYRARASDGKDVALKISHPTTGRLSSQQIIRQQNEIEALARLSHPSLVKVHRYGFTADARFFLAMELVEGVRLDQYLGERRRLDVIEAIQIVRKVAETLAYCHAQGVLHLDLKPENIMLTEPHEPRLKVLDFGLAHLRGDMAGGLGAPARGGTVPYMAPEYFIHGAVLAPDPKLDLYAIGTILYELLSGELTFKGSSLGQLAEFKRYTDPMPIRDRVPSVPEPVAALVHSLLAREPWARYRSAAALATRLKELYYATLAGAPAAGEPPVTLGAGADLTREDDQAPFVGRAAELDALGAELAACVAGASRAVLVVGDAGLGKSRLVSEAVWRWNAGESITLCGRCRQLGELVPYSPLREALGQLAHLALHGSEPRGERLKSALLGVLAAEKVVLGTLVPEFYDSGTPPSDSQSDLAAFLLAGADRVARAFSALLAAAGVPVVLVLEDVHWADEGTLAVVSRLLGTGLPARVLLLATSRVATDLEAAARPPDQPGGGATDEARPDEPSAIVRTLRLLPLPPTENDELLTALVGSRDPTVAQVLKQSIPLLAAGNPLFVTQVVRSLEIEGYVRRVSDGSAELGARSFGEYEPPDSVSTVLQRALRRLDPAVRDVLAAAALIGRQFLITDLRMLGLFEHRDIDAALRAAERHCLCRVTHDVGSFVHDTIREHLEGTVPAARLPEIHGRIARQLQRRGAPAGTLGRHLECAGESRAAAEAYREAGLAADRLHDPRGARRHLERAYGLLASLSPSTERDTMLARTVYHLVRVGCALGDTSETLRTLDDCAGRLEQKTGEALAALESSYARVAYVQGNLVRAIEHGARSLAAVKDIPALRAYQCFPANVIGRARCISGRFGEAVSLLERGSALAREIGEYGELSHSAGLLAVSYGYHGDFASAQRSADTCTDFARRLRDPVRIIAADVYRSALAEAHFDWDQGVKHSTRLLAFAEEHGIGGLYLFVGTSMAGRHQFHVGNLGRARLLLTNALNLSTVMKMASTRSWTHGYLGDVNLVSGDLPAARVQYEAGLALARSMDADELSEPMCLAGLAHLEALAGTASLARVTALCDEAVGRLEAAGNCATLIAVLQRYAESLEALGEAEAASVRMATRARLIERLGLGDCDFWPRIPSGLVASDSSHASRREYWRLFALAVGERSRPSNDSRTTYVTVSTMVAGPTPPSGDPALLESLAAIDGFFRRMEGSRSRRRPRGSSGDGGADQ